MKKCIYCEEEVIENLQPLGRLPLCKAHYESVFSGGFDGQKEAWGCYYTHFKEIEGMSFEDAVKKAKISVATTVDEMIEAVKRKNRKK